ncbi:MAG: hypothetical protein AAFN38_00355 [Cyanobacteria bacterium J06560_5]
MNFPLDRLPVLGPLMLGRGEPDLSERCLGAEFEDAPLSLGLALLPGAGLRLPL